MMMFLALGIGSILLVGLGLLWLAGRELEAVEREQMRREEYGDDVA